MILSGGTLVKSPTTIWSGTPAAFPGWSQIGFGDRWYGYGELYTQQLWVNVLVAKRARATARLPLKVYLRDELNRPEAPTSPYAQLLAKPHPRWSRFDFWLYVSSTFDVFGEAFLLKHRDPGGRPVALLPLHPSCMRVSDEKDGDPVWCFENGRVRVENIPSSELIHPKSYNPNDPHRGLSPLEPLRRTLEFEDAAQRAQSAFWRKGMRPSMALSHPKTLSTPAAERLKFQWDQLAAGADNTGTSVVLEEGMTATPMTINADDAQYIESRKLNREEVCAAYDVPPPVVHILDRATFSNITEQMRSMYRDTMAPHLKFLEDTLEAQLRSTVRPGRTDPDFGANVYAEFLLDEVLRGDFEARADAYQKADWLTVAEKRQFENRPHIDGTDRLYVNAAQVPMEGTAYNVAAALIRAGFDPAAVLETLDLPPIEHSGLPAAPEQLALPAGQMSATTRTLMGRLSRKASLADVDADTLVEGLNGAGSFVRAVLTIARKSGDTVEEFKARLRVLEEALWKAP